MTFQVFQILDQDLKCLFTEKWGSPTRKEKEVAKFVKPEVQ